MKILVIGDVHGRNDWEKAVEKEDFDRIIFCGDYWDSHDIPYSNIKQNFLNIVAFKEANPDKVTLLLGNHDFHYLPVALFTKERYSGFKSNYAWGTRDLLVKYKDLFGVAYLYNNHLFTHAGVTNTWIKRVEEYRGEEKGSVPIDEYINDTFRYNPGMFSFYGTDSSGDDVTQGPLWVRPQSLNEDAFGDYIQVVGHTQQENIGNEPVKFLNNGSGFFIDCPSTFLVIEPEGYRLIHTTTYIHELFKKPF